MNTDVPAAIELVSLVAYAAMLLVVIVIMLGLSWVLGQRHRGRHTAEQYESGIRGTGPSRMRFAVRFYLVAILFVIFDLEVAFIFGWAVAARETGWEGYWGLLVFIAILVVGLIYEWRVGALDWATPRGKRRRIRSGGIDGVS